jgi:putative membrane protein
MFHDMDNFGWGWGMGFGWIFMILFWGLAILGIVALVKWLSGSGVPKQKTPLEILQERYARGEIDREEYQRKKTDLEN